MTKAVFNDFIKRLEKYYGSEKIDEWAIKEYYNACLFVSDGNAGSLYSDLLSSFKFFPRVTEFRAIAEIYKVKQSRAVYANSQRCYCCMDTGIVICTKKGLKPFDNYEYSFSTRCYCEAGKNMSDWPLCTTVITPGELDWLSNENRRKYGDVQPDTEKRAKAQVVAFVKSFG